MTRPGLVYVAVTVALRIDTRSRIPRAPATGSGGGRAKGPGVSSP